MSEWVSECCYCLNIWPLEISTCMNKFQIRTSRIVVFKWIICGCDAGSGISHEQTNQINFIRIKRQRFANRHYNPSIYKRYHCVGQHTSRHTKIHSSTLRFMTMSWSNCRLIQRSFEVSIIIIHFRKVIYNTIFRIEQIRTMAQFSAMEENDSFFFRSKTLTTKCWVISPWETISLHYYVKVLPILSLFLTLEIHTWIVSIWKSRWLIRRYRSCWNVSENKSRKKPINRV